MTLPFLFFGTALSAFGVGSLIRPCISLTRRTRVDGTLVRFETMTDFGLSDSMQRLVVRYKDLQGKTRECGGRPRVTFGWYDIGQTIPVYLSTHANLPPLVGDFQELWLFPLTFCALGALCLSFAFM